ncbi:putative transcriptional regulator [Chondrocystis sp. NIES-4102]|nr:putative transcriptional regulator [Chondrocystis sp. NIES-4102]
MISQAIERRLGLSAYQFNRLMQILLLAVTVLIYNVIAMAIANSLFVSQVGASKLPLVFILIGLCSFPAYGAFSQIADRFSRPVVFRYALLVSICLMFLLRFLVSLPTPWVYYVLLIVIFFQWDFSNNILYAGLLTDYFTTLEYKQYAPYIGIAQAVGTLLGGGITIFLSHYFPSRELLFSLPVFMAIAFGQLLYLERSQRRLETNNQTEELGVLESLKTLPAIVKRYPLVLFLANSSFLLVIIYLSSEFLWFNIYGQHFKESELTSFLGLMRIIISLIQVLFLYGVTRPLLRLVGVARLNAVYPLTTILSIGGLLLNFNLAAAIGLQINGDALYKAINLPIHQLNYNSIPQQYIGRIRSICDGLIYSLGLTTAGGVLWLCHLYLTLEQIAIIAASLTLVLLLVRLPMGKFYTEGLEAMIRADTINLDDFVQDIAQFPPQSSIVIRELLTDGDRYTQAKGLELALNISNPQQFLPEIKALLPEADHAIQLAILKLFTPHPPPSTLQEFANLLQDPNLNVRITALQILIANQYTFDPKQLESLITAPEQEIKILSLIAIFQANSDSAIDPRLAELLWQTNISDKTATAIALVVGQSRNREFITLIEYLLPQTSPQARKYALEALANLAVPQDYHLSKIALAQINHFEPTVRIAAYQILAITHCAEMLEAVAMGYQDNDDQVRHWVAKTIAAYGQAGLEVAQAHLTSASPEIVRVAIASIGQIKTKQANEILYQHLIPEFEQLTLTRRWQQKIPSDDPSWQFLAVAIDDFHQRLLQKVLYILSCLGYARTVNLVTRILTTSDRRDLANAVEVLASINHRRFIQPLIPLLEQKVAPKPQTKITQSEQWLENKGYPILKEAYKSSDRWIQTGAALTLTTLKQSDADVLNYPPHTMNQLLLLRNIPLFKNLSLDELLQIDQALEQKQVLAGETIYTEGSWGWHLYIIADGKIQILKNLDGKQQEIKQLTKGAYFGEIALFDEAPRWDSAIAFEDSILLCLEKKRFISLISQRPQIILEICRFLSKRLRETEKYMSAKNNS